MGSPFRSATNKSFAGEMGVLSIVEMDGDPAGNCLVFLLPLAQFSSFIWVLSLGSVLLSERRSRFRGEG